MKGFAQNVSFQKMRVRNIASASIRSSTCAGFSIIDHGVRMALQPYRRNTDKARTKQAQKSSLVPMIKSPRAGGLFVKRKKRDKLLVTPDCLLGHTDRVARINRSIHILHTVFDIILGYLALTD